MVADSRWALQRDKNGRPVAVLETNTDITAGTRVQEALHKTQSALAHAARVATLGELSASIAHEVNQPLAAIVTNGEAAVRWLDRAEPDLVEARDALGRVIQDGRRASEVIRRIRSLSRKSEQNKAPLNLNEVLAESLALVQREIGTRGIFLQLELAEQLAPVEADRIQMQQVLMNLLMNAVQAMDHAGAGQRRLTIRSFVDGDHNTRVQVEDSGPGFDAETERKTLQRLLHHQGCGHGHGPFDLPLDRRGPWRPDLGNPQCRRRRDLPYLPSKSGGIMIKGNAPSSASVSPATDGPCIYVIDDDDRCATP